MRYRGQFLAVLEQPKALLDFARLRKTPGIFFGEQQMVVGQYVKLPATAFGDLNLLPEPGLD